MSRVTLQEAACRWAAYDYRETEPNLTEPREPLSDRRRRRHRTSTATSCAAAARAASSAEQTIHGRLQLAPAASSGAGPERRASPSELREGRPLNGTGRVGRNIRSAVDLLSALRSYMNNNLLSGTVPTEVGRLTSLRQL